GAAAGLVGDGDAGREVTGHALGAQRAESRKRRGITAPVDVAAPVQEIEAGAIAGGGDAGTHATGILVASVGRVMQRAEAREAEGVADAVDVAGGVGDVVAAGSRGILRAGRRT